MDSCGIRALWILRSTTGEVCFSRRFPAVERQWRQLQLAAAADVTSKASPNSLSGNADVNGPESRDWSFSENCYDSSATDIAESVVNVSKAKHDTAAGSQTLTPQGKRFHANDGSFYRQERGHSDVHRLPFDADISRGFQTHREAMRANHGLRKLGTKPGTDAWLDDPVTQHVIGLQLGEAFLWPVIKHPHEKFTILVLPLVDPWLVANYQALQRYQDAADADGVSSDTPAVRDLSTLLLMTPAITLAVSVASAIAHVLAPPLSIPGPSAPSTASLYSFGLVDSLAGFAKSAAAQKSGAAAAARGARAETTSARVSGVLRREDKDALRTFIAGAMPMGQPLNLNPSLAAAIASNGFGAADVPPADLKQPSWKPYLYRGKQRLTLLVRERVTAALFDRQEVEDVVSISGEVVCRADLEGLPDVTIPLTYPKEAGVRALSVHSSAQSPATSHNGTTLCLSPPLGLFTLARYQAPARCEKAPVRGFFQLQMLSDTQAAVLIQLTLMEGLRKDSSLEHCTLTIPFPGRTIASVDGTPLVGSLAPQENALVWKVVTPGRWFGGKTGEASLSATVAFAVGKEEPGKKGAVAGPMSYPLDDVEDDVTTSATWADPFDWDRYSHARVAFKLAGCSLTETTVNTSGIVIYPPAKAAVEATYEVVEGDYILWNSLGKSPPVSHISGLQPA